MTTKPKTSDTEIRALLAQYAKALHAKDVDAVMACYAPDVVAFDLAPPLEHRGAETGLLEWFPTWRSGISIDTADLAIDAEGDLAVCRSFNHMTGKRTTGEDADLWFRATVCLRRIGGAWKIVHEHASVPFLMDGSFKAAIELKP
jgi:ketosteroid isomerase-like protein